MASINTVLDQCLGVDSPGSVVRDLFDLRRGVQLELSVKRQLGLVRGDAFGINAIVVCPDSFTAADYDEIEFAIQGARDIYDGVGVGIDTVEWYSVPASDNTSQCTLGDDEDDLAEARELSNDYTVDNDHLDVFFVRSIVGSTAGWSAVDGPCSKDSFLGLGFGMSGSVVELVGAPAITAVILAHELGHYFGLEHASLSGNFMRGTSGTNNTGITTGQGATVKDKTCFVTEDC